MTFDETIEKLDALKKGASFEEAESWLLTACDAYRAEHPDDLWGQSALCNELGALYRNNGVFDKGEAAFLRALELHEQAQTAQGAHRADGRLDGGDAERAVADFDVADDARGADYATIVNNLAGLYRMRGDFERAVECFKRAQEAYRRAPFTPPGLYASSFNNLGIAYLDMKDYDRAFEAFEQARSILADAPDEPYLMGSVLCNVAFALHDKGDSLKAAEKMREAAPFYAAAGESGRQAAERCLATAARLEQRG